MERENLPHAGASAGTSAYHHESAHLLDLQKRSCPAIRPLTFVRASSSEVKADSPVTCVSSASSRRPHQPRFRCLSFVNPASRQRI